MHLLAEPTKHRNGYVILISYTTNNKTDPLCEEEKMRFVIIDGGKMGLDDYLKYRLGK